MQHEPPTRCFTNFDLFLNFILFAFFGDASEAEHGSGDYVQCGPGARCRGALGEMEGAERLQWGDVGAD